MSDRLNNNGGGGGSVSKSGGGGGGSASRGSISKGGGSGGLAGKRTGGSSSNRSGNGRSAGSRVNGERQATPGSSSSKQNGFHAGANIGSSSNGFAESTKASSKFSDQAAGDTSSNGPVGKEQPGRSTRFTDEAAASVDRHEQVKQQKADEKAGKDTVKTNTERDQLIETYNALRDQKNKAYSNPEWGETWTAENQRELDQVKDQIKDINASFGQDWYTGLDKRQEKIEETTKSTGIDFTAPISQGVGALLQSIGMQGTGAPNQEAMAELDQIFGTGNYQKVEEKNPADSAFGREGQRLIEEGRQKTEDSARLWEDVTGDMSQPARFAMNVGKTAAHVAMDAGLNLVAPGAGLARMAMAAGGSGVNEQLDVEGHNDPDSLLMKGVTSAAFAFLSEKLIGGAASAYGESALGQTIRGQIAKYASSPAAQKILGRLANTEGLEEGIEDVLNYAADRIFDLNPEAQFNIKEYGMDALVGYIVGTIFNGAEGGIEYDSAKRRAVADEAIDAALSGMTPDEIINAALESTKEDVVIKQATGTPNTNGANAQHVDAEPGSGTVTYDGATIRGVPYVDENGVPQERTIQLEAVDMDSLSDQQRKQIDVVEKMAKATGINVAFFQSGTDENGNYVGDNGLYRNGTIYLDVNAGLDSKTKDGKTVGQHFIGGTASHEITHFIKDYSEEQYNALRDFMIETLSEDPDFDLEERIQQELDLDEDGTMSREDAIEEIVANGCETMLFDSKIAERLAAEQPSTFAKIKEWITDFVNKIRTAFSGSAFDGIEAQHPEAKAMLKYADQLQAMWDEAFEKASRNASKSKADASEQTSPESKQENRKNEREIRQGLESDGDSGADELASGLRDEHRYVRFSKRQMPEPKNTQYGFKLMNVDENGLPHAMFIDAAKPYEFGKWYAAEAPGLEALMKMEPGYAYLVDENDNVDVESRRPVTKKGGTYSGLPGKGLVNQATNDGKRWMVVTADKNGKKSVANVGINGSGGISTFAMRPGIHAVDIPSMKHIGSKSNGSDKIDTRRPDQRWFLVEYPVDQDYNQEAYGNPKKDIRDHLPENGWYSFQTNSGAEAKQHWFITGGMKIVGPVSEADVRKYATDRGFEEDLPWKMGKNYSEDDAIDLEEYMRTTKAQTTPSKEEMRQRIESERVIDTGNGVVSVDVNTESANPTSLSLKHSRKTWNKSDYVNERDKAATELAETLDVSVERAKQYIDDVNSVAKMIADSKGRLDYEETGLSPFVSNSEYGGSFDHTTLCKKRRLLTGTFSEIQKALPNTALTANDILEIRKMMDDAGLEVSCGKCYVEGSRASMGQFTKEFINLYKKYYPGQWAPNMAEMNTPDGVEWVRQTHPEVYEQYEYFWNHYGTLRKGDPNLFASQQKPKLYQMRSAYDGEILKHFKNDSTIEEKNKNGGMRFNSFSDMEIVHVMDIMQEITDMSRVGLAGQGYTKVQNFAWAFGNTGMKINLSIDAWSVDENGNLTFNNKEGMPFEDAMELRDAYSKNVGTICCVYDDAQLLAALADDRIDFIIPFHRSQWKKSQYKSMGLPSTTKDYTYQQNEKWLNPKEHTHEYRGRQVPTRCTNYMPNTYWDFNKSGKENAEEYLRMCARDGKRPKFYKFLQNNGDGSYSLKADGSTDGYWKLLIDFKMYDNDGVGSPQTPVRPDFNMEKINEMLTDYEGGHSQFPVAHGIVDEFVSKYKNEHPGIKYSRRGKAATNTESDPQDVINMLLDKGAITDREASRIRNDQALRSAFMEATGINLDSMGEKAQTQAIKDYVQTRAETEQRDARGAVMDMFGLAAKPDFNSTNREYTKAQEIRNILNPNTEPSRADIDRIVRDMSYREALGAEIGRDLRYARFDEVRRAINEAREERANPLLPATQTPNVNAEPQIPTPAPEGINTPAPTQSDVIEGLTGTESTPAAPAPAAPTINTPPRPSTTASTGTGGSTEEKISQFFSNTLLKREDAGEQEPITYRPKKDVDALNNALSRLNADLRGEIAGLLSAGAWTDEQVHMARSIGRELLNESRREGGDQTAYRLWRDLEASKIGETARGLRAVALESNPGAESILRESEHTFTDIRKAMEENKMLTPKQKEQRAEAIQKAEQETNSIVNQMLDVEEMESKLGESSNPQEEAAVKNAYLDLAEQINTIRHTGFFRDSGKHSAARAGKVDELNTKFRDMLSRQDMDFIKRFVACQAVGISEDVMYQGKQDTLKRLNTFQKLAQLTGTGTWGRNIEGTGSFSLIDMLASDNPLTLLTDKWVSGRTGQRSTGREKIRKNLGAAKMAMERSILEIAANIDLAEDDQTKYDMSRTRTFNPAGERTFERFLSRWEQWNGYMLNSSDAWFKGLSDASIKDAVIRANKWDANNLTKTQKAQLDELGKQVSEYRAFQNTGKAAEAANKLRDEINKLFNKNWKQGQFGVGTALMPYTKVPANIGVKALEFSPMGAVKGAYEVLKARNNPNTTLAEQNKAVTDFGRGVTGTALAVGLAALLKGGAKWFRNWGEEDDKDVAAQNKAEGKSGLQINLSMIGRMLRGDKDTTWRNGDEAIDISAIEPLNVIIAAASLMADSRDGNKLEAYWGTARESVENIPSVSTLANLANTWKYSDNVENTGMRLLETAASTAGSVASGFMPAPVRHAATVLDPMARDTKGDNQMQSMYRQFLSTIPGVKNTLPVKTDNFGNEVSAGSLGTRLATTYLPNRYSEINQSDNSRELERLREETGETLVPARNGPNKTVTLNGEKYELNTEERRDWKNGKGQDYDQSLTELFNNPLYQAANDKDRAAMVAALEDYANDTQKVNYAEDHGIDFDGEYSVARDLDNPLLYVAGNKQFNAAKSAGAKGNWDAVDALVGEMNKASESDLATWRDKNSSLFNYFDYLNPNQGGFRMEDAETVYNFGEDSYNASIAAGHKQTTTAGKVQALMDGLQSGKFSDEDVDAVLSAQKSDGSLEMSKYRNAGYFAARQAGLSASDALKFASSLNPDNNSSVSKKELRAALETLPADIRKQVQNDYYDIYNKALVPTVDGLIDNPNPEEATSKRSSGGGRRRGGGGRRRGGGGGGGGSFTFNWDNWWMENYGKKRKKKKVRTASGEIVEMYEDEIPDDAEIIEEAS